MRTDTTRFVVPQLGLSKEEIITDGFVNAYIGYGPEIENEHVILVYSDIDETLSKKLSPDEIGYKDGDILLYFDLGKLGLKEFYEKFMEGSYSKFSATKKQNILNFWDLSKHSRMHNILYPVDYFYEIDPRRSILYHKGEIWPRPNTLKETLK